MKAPLPRRAVVLVAAGPPGLAVVRESLCHDFELVAVHSLRDAVGRLMQGGIDLILAGLLFDDSVVPLLLETVKTDPSTRAIPFVCCRFVPTVLGRASLRAVRQACEALGAQFVDFFELEQREGRAVAAERLRGVVLQTLRKGRSSTLKSLLTRAGETYEQMYKPRWRACPRSEERISIPHVAASRLGDLGALSKML